MMLRYITYASHALPVGRKVANSGLLLAPQGRTEAFLASTTGVREERAGCEPDNVSDPAPCRTCAAPGPLPFEGEVAGRGWRAIYTAIWSNLPDSGWSTGQMMGLPGYFMCGYFICQLKCDIIYHVTMVYNNTQQTQTNQSVDSQITENSSQNKWTNEWMHAWMCVFLWWPHSVHNIRHCQ